MMIWAYDYIIAVVQGMCSGEGSPVLGEYYFRVTFIVHYFTPFLSQLWRLVGIVHNRNIFVVSILIAI